MKRPLSGKWSFAAGWIPLAVSCCRQVWLSVLPSIFFLCYMNIGILKLLFTVGSVSQRRRPFQGPSDGKRNKWNGVNEFNESSWSTVTIEDAILKQLVTGSVAYSWSDAHWDKAKNWYGSRWNTCVNSENQWPRCCEWLGGVITVAQRQATF